MNRLNEFRTQKGLTLRDLSDLSGIVFSTLSALENGKRKMNAKHAVALSGVLGVAPDILLGSDNFTLKPGTQSDSWVTVHKEFIAKHNRLKEIRIARGYKETQFAEALGVPRSQINHWETGRRPIPQKYFDILCEILNVEEEKLLGIDKSQIVHDAEDTLTPGDYIPPVRERKQSITNNKGYVFVYDPLNPMSGQNGYVPLHRLVMSVHLKRPLKSEEVVHHIDENPSNNKLSNLMLFKNNAEHIRHHKLIKDQRAQKSAHELALSLIDVEEDQHGK